ncbi:MAG: hypothetical protein K9K67_04450 [Bacteriovoracaceae bacterium]|nr:hypothetical protein [Bacteriovoracaceae bacterium]
MSSTRDPHNSSDTSPQRKSHHLDFAKSAQTSEASLNELFDYEPMLSGFPTDDFCFAPLTLGKKTLKAPLWISSMTGGTSAAGPINKNLAKAAGEFGLGLGLGSCRPLLQGDEYFDDFNLRPLIGDGVLFANFGVAQLEQELLKDQAKHLLEVCKRLEVDGLFIHVNPLQEWFQDEGDRWFRSPQEIIKEFTEITAIAMPQLILGIKEVGQGMGAKSLRALLDLPITVIEFAAFGGTNFSLLETLRDKKTNNSNDLNKPNELCYVGHTALEMVRIVNNFIDDKSVKTGDKLFIVSGGIRSFLQGYYLTETLKAPACYGMAKPFLEASQGSYEELAQFVQKELDSLKMAHTFLRPRPLKGE